MATPATSSEESKSSSQTPLQEALGRLAEASPALEMPRLIAVDTLQKIQADARKRVKDSHDAQMKLIDPTYQSENNVDDDMGISVRGDTHITVTQPQEAVKQIAAKAESSLVGKVMPLLGTMLAGGGLTLAGMLAAKYFDKPTTTATAPVTQPAGPADSEYQVLFYDADGNPIKVPHISTKE